MPLLDFLFGGSDNSTTVETSVPEFQQPYLEQGLDVAGNLLQNPPEVYTGPGIAPLSGDTVQSFEDARTLSTGGLTDVSGSLVSSAQDALNVDVLGNPVYGNLADDMQMRLGQAFNEEVMPGLQTQAASLGAFGGTDFLNSQDRAIGQFGDAQSTGLAQLQGSMFQTEMAGRNAAFASMPSILQGITSPLDLLAGSGGTQDARRQAELNDSIGTFNRMQEAPETALDRFIARTHGNIGQTQTTTGPGGDRVAAGVGGAMAGSQFTDSIWGPILGGIGGVLLGG